MEIQLGGTANGLRFIPRGGVFIDVANAVPVGRWTHIACMFDPSISLAKVYINGVDMPTTVSFSGGSSLSTGMPDNTAPINIGRRFDLISNTGSFSLKGSIDEFRIFNEIRTPSQVLSDMQDVIDPTTSSLVFYSRADAGISGADNSGSTILGDLSSNNNSGTLFNFGLTGNRSEERRVGKEC